jgi:hypothetical protein
MPTKAKPNTTQQCTSAYHTLNIPALIKFMHAMAFSPVETTWVKAINKGFFQSWPGITATAVHKYFPKSTATTKGHMDQTRKNTRSTQPLTEHPPTDTNTEQDPEEETDNEITNLLFATIDTTTGKIYTDQTGRFPVTSSQGNQYILVLYDYDTNSILTEPLKNRTGTEILRTYQKSHHYLTLQGFKPQTQWLDNEAYTALK